MAITTLGQVYNQPVLASYMTLDPVEKTRFWQSGVLTSNAIINELARGASNIINIPFWNPIDSSVEPNYTDDVYLDVAVPRAIDTGVQSARVAYLNEGFGSADLVAELTKQDPLASIAARLDNFWMRNMERRLIATVVGLYNDNVAANGGDMVVNVSAATGAVTDANKFSVGAFLDAGATMGDSLDQLGAIAMHRAVYTDLQKQNVILFVPSSDAKTVIPTYQGLHVIVDNNMPAVGTGTGVNKQYLSVIFGPGAIGYGEGQPEHPLEYWREASRGNGGGVETLWTRKTAIMHPFGYKFESAVITGNGTETTPRSASWSDLTNATNWTRVVNRLNVPLAFLVTNA